MGRNKGTFNFSSTFEVLNKAPLDARLVVDIKADLIDPSTWRDAVDLVWLFDGIVVSVVSDPSTDNNGLYFLTEVSTYTNYNSWTKIGGTVPTPTILTYDGSIIGDGATTIFPIIHNLNTRKQTITIWDNSDDEIIYPGIARGASTNYIAFASPPDTSTTYNITILGF